MDIIVFSLKFLTVKELGTQHIYFKAILTSEFESKNMLLWKRGSSFISTEDENCGLLPD